MINLTADIIGDFKVYFPYWLQSNNVLYNLHSIIRFTCFSYFFILLPQSSFTRIKKILPSIFILFITVNFSIAEYFFYEDHLSGNLLAAEAYLLLIYCMIYYLSQLREDIEILTRGKDFWIVTGLSIYVVSNFFVFLFYVPMITENMNLAANMWNVHNASYILLCLFIARSFYVSA
ncbi:hypothetical protein [Daejeonella oryzae]|uniref:hypothetical protein n=1 Tax=Daejeonella oryzae TaxID=1122943 RepID=UPI001C65F850|nr:hypothetical protein [Daejeonella oryzae]